MLATTRPQPPHLLNAFPAYPSSEHHPDDMTPSPSQHHVDRARTPTAGKGIKGLFSRTRVASPEPDPTIRARLLSFIGESIAGPSNQSTQPARNHKDDQAVKQQLSRRHAGNRPPTPDGTRRNIRFGPSLLPAMQKGEDGKWQTPSLSRGSLSTSALNLYAQDDNNPAEGKRKGEVMKDAEKGHKHTLSVLFNSRKGRRGDENVDSKDEPIAKTPSRDDPRRSYLVDRRVSDKAIQPVSSPRTPIPDRTLKASPKTPGRASTAPHQVSQGPVGNSPVMERIRASQSSSADPGLVSTIPQPEDHNHASPTKKAPSTPSSPRIRSGASTPQPFGVNAGPLSKNHLILRLATSYLVRSLIPLVRGSSSSPNEKTVEMRRLADEHISVLARMEKSWGGDWARAAVEAAPGNVSATTSSSESKIREVHVGERAKERERRIWVDVIRDGVLLCLLLNHLFPANPQHISRVNITEDGILRATNLTRFHNACENVGLSRADIFNLSDLHEASEISMGRVAGTVIALAQLAGPTRAAVARPMSPMQSPIQSRSPSKTTTEAGGQRNLSPHPSNTGTLPPTSSLGEKRLSAEDASKGHLPLHVDTTRPAPDPYRTPTTSAFVSLPATPLLSSPNSPRQVLTRATTQPNVSPLLLRSSAQLDSPSGSSTPIGRIPGRPMLRPRHTTGSKSQVSFAETNGPTSPRRSSHVGDNSGLHARERTPSLISSGSRVTSGYTRSSGAFSVSTVIGDDESHMIAIAIASGTPENSISHRRGERRMSERTLENARRKLGALLSSEDLPQDLQEALDTAEADTNESRDSAITQSLAALEGWKGQNVRPGIDVSPRHRPPPTARPLSQASRHGEVPRVVEEDENSLARSQLSDGPRKSMIRRVSANGKTYVLKRSTSPSPNARSSTPTAVPFPAASPMANTRTIDADQNPDPNSPDRSILMERRQSDGYSYPSQTREQVRPMNVKHNSMVNLTTATDSSLVFRESIIKAGRSQQMQVLDFNEPGFPPVKYQLGNCVGKGQFGAVYRSLNLGTGQMAAIKRIRLEGMKEAQVTDVMHEVELLKRLSHPSIVKYEGMSRDDEYLNIVLEYVENGSLGQVLKAFGKFNEKLASSYVAKILEGLDYLHSQGVVHCDLKAANILSTKNGNVKLSDFGVSLNMKAVENLQQDAATASRSNAAAQRPVSDVAGTPNWMAPEVISLNGAVPASDIWSLGCTIIELLTGKPPFAEIDNSMSVLFRIVEDDMPPLPAGISDDLVEFLKLCFIKDPKYRPPAVVLFEHPWVKKLNPDLALRPQDSVPFLRRVSMDLRRMDSNRLFPSDQGGMNSNSATPSVMDGTSEIGRPNRYSIASSHGREASDTHKEHELIKTTFGKAILCRLCHASVKKAGVLCQHCGLICHTACATKAPGRCDVTEQLALLARQQDYLAIHIPNIAISAASSRRASFDVDQQEGTSFTALPGKIFHGLKRTKTNQGSSIDLTDDRRRRTSSNLPRTNTSGSTADSRPSLDISRRTENNSQSRASVFSEASVSEADGGDIRRRSAIRFETNDGVMMRRQQEKRVDVEVVPITPDTPVITGGRKGHKAKDSKSECLIM